MVNAVSVEETVLCCTAEGVGGDRQTVESTGAATRPLGDTQLQQGEVGWVDDAVDA